MPYGIRSRRTNSKLLRVKEEITDPTIVDEKKKEYTNEVELTLERKKSEEQHQQTKFENVLVGIDRFSFPINCATVGMEEEQQVSFVGTPSTATSQT